MMHKDLSYLNRHDVEDAAICLAVDMAACGQSLALTREAMINAFDKAAEELEA